MATNANPTTINNTAPLMRASTTKKDLSDGTQGTVTLRDYQHAKKIFVDGNFRLSPKYGFLFYVEFDFNPLITNVSNTAAQEMGMIVKTCSLPKFTVDTKTHNAYNRKNIVQNKISYDPISITFHDDQADNVRTFWYDYYSYFYRDSDYADATYDIIHKYQERPSFGWGYTPRPTASFNSQNAYQTYQYIQGIRIYSLYQKNFSEYHLVNPTITSFKHGDHNTSEGSSLLEHQMQIQYEAVKYYSGYTTENTAGGYIDLHYDRTPTPIAPTAGVDIVGDGMGGYAVAPSNVTDLANYNLSTAGGTVIPYPNGGAINSASSFATIASGLLGAAGTAATNAGGFALPALGSLLTGISGGALAGGQLGSATNILGMATAAISNPKAALATIQNMATQGVMTAVTQAANQAVAGLGTGIAGPLNTALGTQAKDLAGSLDKGITGLTTAIGDAYNTAHDLINGLTATTATFDSAGAVDATNIAGWADGGG